MKYLNKIWILFVYFGIWFGIPHWLVVYNENIDFYMMVLFMWVPAGYVVAYLQKD